MGFWYLLAKSATSLFSPELCFEDVHDTAVIGALLGLYSELLAYAVHPPQWVHLRAKGQTIHTAAGAQFTIALSLAWPPTLCRAGRNTLENQQWYSASTLRNAQHGEWGHFHFVYEMLQTDSYCMSIGMETEQRISFKNEQTKRSCGTLFESI